MRPHAGRLGDDRTVQIRQPEITLGQGIAHAPQQDTAVYPAVLLVGIGKVATDVSQSGRSQQCIADCMHQHVSVRMGLESLVVINSDATDGDMGTFAESMGIKSMTDTHNL